MSRRLPTTDVANIAMAKGPKGKCHNLVTHRDFVASAGPGSNYEFCDRQRRRTASPPNCQRRCPGWRSITYGPWGRLRHGAGHDRGHDQCLANRSHRVPNREQRRGLAAAYLECNSTNIASNLGPTSPARRDNGLCQGWVGRLVRPDRRRLSPV